MKFKSQRKYKEHENDLFQRSFGLGVVIRLKKKQGFICCTGSEDIPTVTKNYSNFKVNKILKRVQEISMEAWIFGNRVLYGLALKTIGSTPTIHTSHAKWRVMSFSVMNYDNMYTHLISIFGIKT